MLAFLTGTSIPASASTFSATELSYDSALLSQFNLINLGTLNATNGNGTAPTTDGRVVAGSITTGTNGYGACANVKSSNCKTDSTIGASSSATAGVTAVSGSNPAYGALTVFGNISGAVTLSPTTSGTAYVAGNVQGSGSAGLFSAGNLGKIEGNSKTAVDVVGTLGTLTNVDRATSYTTTQNALTRGGSLTNTPTANYGKSAASVFPFASEAAAFSTPLQNLYAGLANLPGTPGVKADALPTNSTGIFTSGVDYTGSNGKTYGVVTATLADFSAEPSSFTGVANNAANAATFVIITGSGSNDTLPTITTADPNVIYDFVSATSLQLGSTFDGTILAPLATLTTGSGTVNGTVVVASLNQTQALYNTNAFTGDLSGLASFTYNARVPEPASIALFSSGIAGLAWLQQRRKNKRP